MKLNAPRVITWWISLILAAAGLLAKLFTIPVLTPYAFWLVLIGAALLLLATAKKGL